MAGSFLFRVFPRFAVWACLSALACLVVLRAAVWATGAEHIGEDVIGGPQIIKWHVADPDFGGMSALFMGSDGATLVAGGDHGTLVEARVRRDAAGRISAVEDAVLTSMMLPGGRAPLTFKMDFEALTRDPVAGWFTAFEGIVRIERLKRAGVPPQSTHSWDRFAGLFGNQAFEALATLRDGRVIAFTEPQVGPNVAGSVIYDGAGWRQGPRIPVGKGFNITGADLGPDGCLYLVERRYSVASGFTFAVRRLSGGPGAWVDTTLYVSPPAHLGNAEGLSTWEDDTGDIMVTVITDNGFWPRTPTRLIEMRLQAGTECALDLRP